MDQASFLTALKEDALQNGYLTPEVTQFIEEAGTKATKEEFQSFLNQKITDFAHNRKASLQSLFILRKLLNNYDFPAEIKKEAAVSVLELLRSYYYTTPQLPLNDYDLNVRLSAWGILKYLLGGLDEEFRVQYRSLVEFASTKEGDSGLKKMFLDLNS